MRRSTIVVGAGLLVIAALVGYCQARTTQLSAAFEKVVVGDTERDVIAKMGHPHQVLEGCGYYYPHKRPIVGCAREYVFFPPWSIVDEAWTISFNANGNATNTAHFLSP
jgi:hypothetical protein